MSKSSKTNNPLKEKIHEIIFEAETPMGKAFDVALLYFIFGSILVVMLESIDAIGSRYANLFFYLEWIFTIFFTAEYFLRIYCVHSPKKYMTSFFGIIDLMAILPTYLSLFVAGTQYLVAIRALRILRVFRILKLASFLKESNVIVSALKASRTKITVFTIFVMIMVTILGSVMYVVEGPYDSGFDSIPRSIYWAIVTLTTVGYGDISPISALGQFIAAIVMILGYSVIAVPTGIVSAEIANANAIANDIGSTRSCQNCGEEGHAANADFCKFCGSEL